MNTWLEWFDTHQNLSGWFGGFGTLVAAVVALGAMYVQWRSALVAESKKRFADEANTLLALKYLASELRRMCTLSGFQVDAPGNPIIYPDISAEFRAIANMLGQLPVDQISARGCISHWLHLRRVAMEMSSIYLPAPEQGDGFYLKNRNRIRDLDFACSKTALEIGGVLQVFAPEVYSAHRAALERL
ncbi:hypothetical protein [Duganella sp. BJB475]|uniref:hypothetical protein n=1 Tax=Duganella sp. BJB475 TaxID=2233914 RepID=UPI0011C17F24|nr:hypothetical protein [Duganella sp. BJB475]